MQKFNSYITGEHVFIKNILDKHKVYIITLNVHCGL